MIRTARRSTPLSRLACEALNLFFRDSCWVVGDNAGPTHSPYGTMRRSLTRHVWSFHSLGQTLQTICENRYGEQMAHKMSSNDTVTTIWSLFALEDLFDRSEFGTTRCCDWSILHGVIQVLSDRTGMVVSICTSTQYLISSQGFMCLL